MNIKGIRKVVLLCFIVITVFALPVLVKADEYTGSGTTSIGCKGSSSCVCNQGSNQLCIWDVKNHVILKVSLYYFPNKTGLNGGIEIGNVIYANGNISYYTGMGFFSGKQIYSLPSSFPTSTRGGIYAPTKAFFYYDTNTFITVFNNITGYGATNMDSVKTWMTNYCQTHGYGNSLAECSQTIGGSKGFRIVIQPILSGIYGDSNSIRVGTVKEIFRSYNIWNSTDTKTGVSTALYIDPADLGFSAGVASPYAGDSTVADYSSGYGLNMFTWPVDNVVTACNPDLSGVKTCCSLYGITSASDAANNNTSLVTRPMTNSELKKAGCTSPVVTSCSYSLNKTVPTACSSSTSGLVSDNTSWSCTFQSTTSDKDSSVKSNYIYSSFSNKYCSVYCQEKIEVSLPGAGGYSYDGSYFVLASNSGLRQIGPITYTGTSTCRVTSTKSATDGTINVTKFVSDFKAANDAVLKAYDNWQYAELQNEVINNSTSHSWSTTCSDSWCTATAPNTCAKGVSSCGSHCTAHDSCSVSRSGTYYTYTNKTYYGATYTKSTGISNGSCSCSSRCGSSCTAKVGLKDTASLKATYVQAVNNRTALLEQLKQCNNFYRTYSEFKPKVNFVYNDEVYKGTYSLVGTGTATSSTEYFNSGNSTGSKNTASLSYNNSVNGDSDSETASYKTNSSSVRGYSSNISYYDCGTSVTKTGCTKVSSYEYPTNTWYEQVTKRVYNYKLQTGLNNYVDKPSGFSSSTASTNYDYIPFSNLPVHYSTTPGKYTYYVNTISYGNNNKFNKFILQTGTNFNGTSYYYDGKYSCTYTINCDKTIVCGKNSCDTSCSCGSNCSGGTDLLFRSISLYYPFPGQNGTELNQRKAGYNWSNVSTDISKYIYNARGVSYYDLYKLDPMYEITLTPALMRKIKEYNTTQNNTYVWYYKNTSKESYSATGYSDFSLTCQTGTDGRKNQKCKSSVIRSWGVKGCAIAGSGYTKCGTTVAW